MECFSSFATRTPPYFLVLVFFVADLTLGVLFAFGIACPPAARRRMFTT